MVFLYGRTGPLTAKIGPFRPGWAVAALRRGAHGVARAARRRGGRAARRGTPTLCLEVRVSAALFGSLDGKCHFLSGRAAPKTPNASQANLKRWPEGRAACPTFVPRAAAAGALRGAHEPFLAGSSHLRGAISRTSLRLVIRNQTRAALISMRMRVAFLRRQKSHRFVPHRAPSSGLR
jgi:hypothetical protein